VVQGQPGQKVCETPFESMTGHGLIYLSSQIHWESQIEGWQFRLALS
jgi:hypothetical protein